MMNELTFTTVRNESSVRSGPRVTAIVPSRAVVVTSFEKVTFMHYRNDDLSADILIVWERLFNHQSILTEGCLCLTMIFRHQ